jgi:hypothetical protein
VIVITLHRNGAPGGNRGKSFLWPLDQRGKAPKMDCASVTVQGKQITLIQDCIADLTLTAIQINREVRAGNKTDFTKLSRHYCRVGSTSA